MATRTPARRPAPAPAKRPAPAPARRPARRRPQGPQRGTNISAPAIAAEGRNLAAENVGFINQNLPAAANNFSNIQQGQIDAQAGRLDNRFTQSAIDAGQNVMGQSQALGGLGSLASALGVGNMISGPTRSERQLQRLGQQAMGVRADQVVEPTNVREVAAQNVSGAQLGAVRDVSAVNADRVRNVRASNVGQGQLGSALMQQAISRASSNGMLSPEASRDAVQAARQGMAARGLATGGAGMAAELLNRDRYSRARMAEDNAFAAAVQQQDIARQFSNVGNRLQASLANQGVAAQQSLANQAAAMDAQRLNQGTDLSIAQADAQFQQQANLANQDAAMRAGLANQQRDQFLGQTSMEAQRLNQAANMQQTDANRSFMLNANNAVNQGMLNRQNFGMGQLGLGANLLGNSGTMGMNYGNYMTSLDPYSRAMSAGINMGQFSGQAAGNMLNNQLGGMIDLSGNAATFNTNRQDSLYNNYQNNRAAMRAANMQAGAQQNAGMMGIFGGIGGGVATGIAAASF
jgi:hypothetical protein